MILVIILTAGAICIGTIFVLLFIGQRPCHPAGHLMSVLGSGGHTTEMMALLQSFLIEPLSPGRPRFNEITFVSTETDSFSEQKLDQTVPIWRRTQIDQHTIRYRLVKIPRSRDVHQSFWTSILTSLWAFCHSLRLMASIRPRILLCNGPGVCVPVVLAARLLSPRTLVVYVESFCRTRTLSLSGQILYHARLAHHFLVQWPHLAREYPHSKYLGLLV